MRHASAIAALILALFASDCYAQKSLFYTNEEMAQLAKSDAQSCRDAGTAEANDAVTKACLADLKKWVHIWADQFKDPAIPDRVWNTCFRESGFPYNRDFGAWARCNRIGATEPWMQSSVED